VEHGRFQLYHHVEGAYRQRPVRESRQYALTIEGWKSGRAMAESMFMFSPKTSYAEITGHATALWSLARRSPT
jgi:hypothetical protein